MPTKQIEPFEHGLTWVMSEWMQRGSHALAHDGKVWLVDPVDEPAAIEQARALGEFAGVIQLLDRHPRDCAALAEHYGVPHHILPDDLPGTPFQILSVLRGRAWKERAIWWPDTGTLVIAETLGTNPYYAVGAGPVGVHPMLRALTGLEVGDHLPVKHLLVGHGSPVHEDAAASIQTAYARRLRDLPFMIRGIRAFQKSAFR